MKHRSKWSFFSSLALSLILGISGVCHADSLVGAKEETMWGEEYTDTDTGKGMLVPGVSGVSGRSHHSFYWFGRRKDIYCVT